MATRLLPALLVLFLTPALRADPPAAVAPADAARLFAGLAARPLGPATMGGRIVDIAVAPSRPDTVFVAAATGGLWKSADAGLTWTACFDDQPTLSLGAVAVAPTNPDVVYVGTGEANPRNSVSYGMGVYRSTDGGKTWRHCGLADTHHVGRIAVHPRDPDTAYVAALGRLWGPNRERGLFRTRDGGKTWQHVLALDADTGVIDVVIDPDKPAVVYAAAWCVRRDAFSGGNPRTQTGPRAGLYRSTDGGDTWQRLAGGLPTRPLGRCGLAISPKDPRTVYAVVQTDQTDVSVRGQPARDPEAADPAKAPPEKAPPDKPAARGPLDAEKGGVFRSDDRGTTWTKLNDLCPRPFYYGQVRIDPANPQRIYVLGIALHVSDDGGKSFPTRLSPRNVHPDHHALAFDPRDPSRVWLGNDGGLYTSRDRGASWQAIRAMPLGQFYGIAADSNRPYRVYGGLQDNGTWGGPSATDRTDGITTADWKRLQTADGFQVQVDPTDPNTVYAESQYGRPVRHELKAGRNKRIQPTPPRGEPAYRFNWDAPMLLSPHDPKVLYFGANRLFRSADRGDTWTPISPDLTRPPANAPVNPYGHTLTAVAESPLKAGLLWAGTDDGRLHLTRDGGATWTELTRNLPGVPSPWWVSRVECSPFAEGTAYVALDRHRQDDRRPHLFRTDDYGVTWQSLAAGLPSDGPVKVIRTSSRNRHLLFAGTEFGLFGSLDAGRTWHRLSGGLPPAVMVYDLLIHPRERDLVVGTHGRSLYAYDVAPLEEATPAMLTAPAALFPIKPTRPMTLRTPDKPDKPDAPKAYAAPNPPAGAVLYCWLNPSNPAPSDPPRLVLRTPAGQPIRTLPVPAAPGLTRVVWDLKSDGGAAVPPGDYTATLTTHGHSVTRPVRLETP